MLRGHLPEASSSMNSRSVTPPAPSPATTSPATVRLVPVAVGSARTVSSAEGDAASAVILRFTKPDSEAGPERSGASLWIHGYRGKRLFDLVVGGALLAFLSPLLVAIVGVLAVLRSGNWLDAVPAIGLDGRRIRLLRFRTRPSDVAEIEAGEPEEGIVRLPSRPGAAVQGGPERWLVASGWDRLPGLWNVLAGQIHLVGSAPEVSDESGACVDLTGAQPAMPPGLFCPWGQAPASKEPAPAGEIDEMEYVARQGWWTDLCIVIRKLWAA